MKLLLSRPRGFCAGVVRAIDVVERALDKWGAPIYVKHEIVHNKHVVERLHDKGAIFIEDLKEVPEGSRIIYSAHGVPPSVRREASLRGLIEIDATCILVNKCHEAVKKYAKQGYKVVVIGHKKHVEVIGTAGEAPDDTFVVDSAEDVLKLPFGDSEKVFCLSQTTLSFYDVKVILDVLKERFDNLETLPSSSICYATTNRQKALTQITKDVEIVFVVGDSRSSNSNRLWEIAKKNCIKAYLINDASEIDYNWLEGVSSIGLTAGASTPEYIVQGVIAALQKFGVDRVEDVIYTEENVTFPLPKELEG